MLDILRERQGYFINESNDNDDKPAKYNPLYLLGRGLGYITKRADQGFSKEYGGVRLARQAGYGHLNKQHVVARESYDADQSSMYYGAGLGKAFDDGNRLYNIGINNYSDSDANFIGDGDDPNTSRANIPAIIAARMAGGIADPKTVINGINRRSPSFKLRSLRDDNGY